MEIMGKRIRNITKKYNLDKPKQTNSSRRVDGEIIKKSQKKHFLTKERHGLEYGWAH